MKEFNVFMESNSKEFNDFTKNDTKEFGVSDYYGFRYAGDSD